MVSTTGNEVLGGEVGLEGESSGDWLSEQAARATAARAAHRRGKRGKGTSGSWNDTKYTNNGKAHCGTSAGVRPRDLPLPGGPVKWGSLRSRARPWPPIRK